MGCRRCVVLALGLAAGLVAGCDGQGMGTGQDPLGIFGTPSPDSDQQYTILLMDLKGPRHNALADYYLRTTKRFTGWKDLFAIHKDTHSLLFWGKYPSIDAAQENLRRAKGYRSKQTGLWPFKQAMVGKLPGKDPGPAEWSVVNVPEQYYYTVMVADFFNIPKPLDLRDKPYLTRKRDAVAYCRELREKGWEAYYHHGPSHSAVMIGKFDNSVIQIAKRPGKPPQKVVVGEQVKRIQAAFPRLAVNGYEQKKYVRGPDGQPRKDKKGRPVIIYEKCRLIKIPERDVKAPSARPPRVSPVPPPDRPRLFP